MYAIRSYYVISLYGSGSKAGFLALGAAVLFLLFFLRKPILKQWFIIIPIFTALIATFLLIDQYKDGEYLDRIKSALTISKDSERDITSMITEDDDIALVMNGNELYVTMIV